MERKGSLEEWVEFFQWLLSRLFSGAMAWDIGDELGQQVMLFLGFQQVGSLPYRLEEGAEFTVSLAVGKGRHGYAGSLRGKVMEVAYLPWDPGVTAFVVLVEPGVWEWIGPDGREEEDLRSLSAIVVVHVERRAEVRGWVGR